MKSTKYQIYELINKLKLITIALWMVSMPSFCQEWSPAVENFNTEDFNASIPNLAVLQDSTGLLFFGNLSGLLVHDGIKWEKHLIENGSVINQLHRSSINQIYFASNNKFGFLDSDKSGKLIYHIISDTVNTNNLSRINNILDKEGSVYILTKEKLLKWDNGAFSSFNSEFGGFQSLFKYKNEIFTKERNGNIMRIVNEKFVPLTNDGFSPSTIISSPFNLQGNKYFFSVKDFSLFRINQELKIDKINNPFNSQFEKPITYKASYKDGYLGISTLNEGIIICNNLDSTFLNINKSSNLISNSVTGILFDNQYNLWATLVQGIGKINYNKALSTWNSKNGLTDIIIDIIKFDEKIYVCTINGVFFFTENKWIKIKNLNSRTISFLKIANRLFVSAAEKGFYEIKNETAYKIDKIKNAWITASDSSNNIYIPSEKEGLIKFQPSRKKEKLKLLNSNLSGTAVDLNLKKLDSSWISIKWEGLYLVKIEKDTAKSQLFNQKNGLPDVTEIGILELDNEIYFTTSNGFYELNSNPNSDLSNLFIPSSRLPTGSSVNLAVIDKEKSIWYTTKNNYGETELKKLLLSPDGNYIDKSQPLKRFPNQTINKIYPDPERAGIIWVAGAKGLFKFDENAQVDTNLKFNTLIRKVYSSDSTIFNGYFTVSNKIGAPSFVSDQPIDYIPNLKYQNNNIKFEFSASAYTQAEKNEYAYYLKDVDANWSKWSRNTQKEYSNLSPGTYTFQVKSKNFYGTKGNPTSYTFTVISPWYLTNWAKFLFSIAGILLIWMIILLYSYRLRMHRKSLKLLVADRTFEVMLQKKELEKQYALLSDQNEEMLLQSEQIELKNQNLEQHQEEILTINNQLEEINTHLEKKVEKRTAKIKSTLDKLKQTNKELDTFIYKASHDLKGPLSRILGLSSLAKIETPNEKNIQYLEMIESTSRDMDLLLSKLTQVHEIFNQKPKIIPLLMEEILEEVKLKLSFLPHYKQTKVSLNNHINSPLKADHQLFYTVIYNLIENAFLFKNSENTEIHKISVDLSKTSKHINIKISDNGIGIEEDLLDAIFDMFYRASDQSKGSGLGLYLVRIAIEKMHGKISVESEIGKGTIFTIRLPL